MLPPLPSPAYAASPGESCFHDHLSTLCRSLQLQLELAKSVSGLHPSPLPGYHGAVGTAVGKLSAAIDDFRDDVWAASSSDVNVPGVAAKHPSPATHPAARHVPMGGALRKFGPLAATPEVISEHLELAGRGGADGTKGSEHTGEIVYIDADGRMNAPKSSAADGREEDQVARPNDKDMFCSESSCDTNSVHGQAVRDSVGVRPSLLDAQAAATLYGAPQFGGVTRRYESRYSAKSVASFAAYADGERPQDGGDGLEVATLSTDGPRAGSRRPLRVSEWERQQGDYAFLDEEDEEDMLEDEIDVTSIVVQGVLNPNWPGRLAWDFGVIVLVIIDAFVLPMQMAYFDGQKREQTEAFNSSWLWITTSFFASDIMINFFTAYVAGKREPELSPGALVCGRCMIARNYGRTWFPIDFVSTIPWGVVSEFLVPASDGDGADVMKLTKVVKFARFLRLIRMLRLAKLGAIWERIEAKLGSLYLLHSVVLIKVIGVIIVICHWNACVWWILGQRTSMISEMMSAKAQTSWQEHAHWATIVRKYSPSDDTTFTWETKAEENVWEAYVFCFYWTLGVMRTMPAEVQPTNLAERLYILIFMMVAVVTFAITLTQITQAFLKLSERKKTFNEDMALVRMELRNCRASETLQVKAKSFLRHLFERRKIQAKEHSILGHLPQQMTKMLNHHKLCEHLRKISQLDGLSLKALYLVSEIAETLDFLPGDKICTRGSVAEAAYVLVAGRLRSKPNHSYNIEVVDDATLSTLDTVYSMTTVVTVLCCEVIKLDKKKFFKVFKRHPVFDRRSSRRPSTGSLTSGFETQQVPMTHMEMERRAAADRQNQGAVIVTTVAGCS